MTRPGTWEPGQSGNPKGRVKNPLTGVLEALAGKTGADGFTHKKRVARKVWQLAEEGDMNAIRFLWDRIVGKPPETIELAGTVTHEHYDLSQFHPAEVARLHELAAEYERTHGG